MLVSQKPAESYAGDVLLLPIAGVAFWTLAYQLVLVVRWPANTIMWCFLAIVIPGFFLLERLFKKTNATPGNGYRFHLSHIFLFEFCQISVDCGASENADAARILH